MAHVRVDVAVHHVPGDVGRGGDAACAAGLATQEIYERENLFERANQLSDYFLDKVFDLRDIDLITDIRGYGLMAAIDVKPEKAPGVRGTKLQKKLFWNGLHIKFTGDAAIIAPPLVSEKEHIDQICRVLRETLESEG